MIDAGDEGVLGSVEPARAFLEAYVAVRSPSEPTFEIVEVVAAGRSPRLPGRFLGHDLSQCLSFSLLSWGLELVASVAPNAVEPELMAVIGKIEDQFKRRLNANGLIDDADAARHLLACMNSVQAIRPGFWEDTATAPFEVLGLYSPEA